MLYRLRLFEYTIFYICHTEQCLTLCPSSCYLHNKNVVSLSLILFSFCIHYAGLLYAASLTAYNNGSLDTASQPNRAVHISAVCCKSSKDSSGKPPTRPPTDGDGSGKDNPPITNDGEKSAASSKGSSSSSKEPPNKGSTLRCPRCGDACTHVGTFVSMSRFVKCVKCNHFFVVLNDDKRVKSQAFKTAENLNTNSKQPPPPKKIMEYLDQHIIGQDLAKKVLSVAVYNHYKRIYHNAASTTNNKNQKLGDFASTASSTGSSSARGAGLLYMTGESVWPSQITFYWNPSHEKLTKLWFFFVASNELSNR